MNTAATEAFLEAAGFPASRLQFEIKLWVGSIALISAVLLLAGLMKLLQSDEALDKSIFLFGLLCISFFVSLIFISLA